MPNMSYCRFENTLYDLRDCRNALDEGDDLPDEKSEYEYPAMINLIRMCKIIARDYGHLDTQGVRE